jgi:hypothetical protein
VPLWSPLLIGLEFVQGGVRFAEGVATRVSLLLPPGKVTAAKCGPCER